MWIFLNDAFLSVVADREDPKGERLLVRARRQGDIERVFPEASVFSVDGADYAFRAWVPRQRVAEAMAARVGEIDYPNFKNAIHDTAYHDAALSAWSAMHAYQSRQLR
ncbi:hypothetical protein [Cyanobium sp. Morenito 9A2]|uniref:hypothetical protein n=1 Tax=Cyanobium sp. Morenito 9A2 TaxID=2823718 RepID=UPI0020CE0CBC|nr:hypothetical protein [Cyanobium sp. Morenito 9A2]MCP9850776.1 hypothetical protein [Cyanobium sp. Morenito 9A2]